MMSGSGGQMGLLNSVVKLHSWLCRDIIMCGWQEGREHGALRPQKPLRLVRDGELGRSGIYISNTKSLRCHHQNDSALRWAVV